MLYPLLLLIYTFIVKVNRIAEESLLTFLAFLSYSASRAGVQDLIVKKKNQKKKPRGNRLRPGIAMTDVIHII